GGGDEPGEVGDGSAAEADDEALTGERGPPEPGPQVGEDGGGLRLLTVGDPGEEDLVPGDGQRGADPRGPLRQRPLERELPPPRLAAHRGGDLRLQPASDEHLVVVLGPDRDPGRDHAVTFGRSSPRSRASAMRVASLGTGSESVFTTSPATSSYSGRRASSSAFQRRRGLSTRSGRAPERPTRGSALAIETSR